MTPINDFQHFAGLVAAGPDHAVAVFDLAGACLEEFEFGSFGWRDFQNKLAAYPGLAVAAEALEGRVMDQLLLRGFAFFPVTPQNMAALVEQFARPEPETVRSDARVLAEALRIYGHGWKALTPQDPLIGTFRESWTAQRDSEASLFRSIQTLTEAIEVIFPELLPVFDWSETASWAFVEKYPLPSVLRQGKRRHIEAFLQTHELLGTPAGERCLALFSRARELRDQRLEPLSGPDHLREMAKHVTDLSALVGKLQFVSAMVLQIHPDFPFFGPHPASGAPSTPASPSASPGLAHPESVD